MMLNRQITTTSYGQRYAFRLRNSGSLPKSLSPEKFSDLGLAYQFVRTLNLPTAHWRSLTHFGSTLNYAGWRSSNPWASIEQYIARCLVRGDIQAYKVKAVSPSSSGETKSVFKNQFGTSYHFMPASSALFGNTSNAESASDKTAALALISQLNLTKPELIELTKSLDLPSGGDYAQLNDVLSEAIMNSEVLVCSQEPFLKTSPDQGAPSEPATDTSADNTPHPEASPAAGNNQDQNQDQEEEVVCKLTKLTVTCAHGGRRKEITRNSVANQTLEVVASETAARGFDKIKATVQIDAPCGSHPTASSSIMPKPAKTVKGSLENVYHLACAPVTNPLKFLWLPSLKPKTYKIAASACERFKSASINVDVYPKVKWDIQVGYSLAKKSQADGAMSEDRTNASSNVPADNSGGFKGHVVFSYDEDKRKLTAEYKKGIDAVLKRLEWIRDKVDTFLNKMSEYGPIKLEVFWPELSINYTTGLSEDKTTPYVVTTYDLSINANPLIGLKGSFDAFPVILNAVRTTGAGAPIAAVLDALMKGVGNDESFVSLEADIKLVFSIASKVSVSFKSSGNNGRSNGKTRSEQAIAMDIQLEGLIGVKGHVWIIKYEKNYRAGIKTGFVGKAIIEKDSKGFFWYSQFTFNGITIYFTKYEKLEKSVQANAANQGKFGNVFPDKLEDSDTTSFTWLKSEPDTESPAPSNRKYLIEF